MKGTLAPQAAGVIHSDFERGFIKAEVCAFDDFKALHEGQASMAKVKEAGKYRQEGKTYVMNDGDIGAWFIVYLIARNEIIKAKETNNGCCILFRRLVVFMHNVTASKKK